jgi:putative Mg2+ transporter-C (MgtC) family protein
MPLELHWPQIALRLAMAFVAAAAIGINRGEYGRPAGLRTCLLVCLAAALAMIMANLLLATTGKTATSFVQVDPMRLPLGILSGIGFIGGGAILRRGDRVLGVTTAATLWFVTVLGLCFGAGMITLGCVGLALGMIVLWLLRWVDARMHRERHANLILVCTSTDPSDEEIRGSLGAERFGVESWAVTYADHGKRRRIQCDVRWRAKQDDTRVPGFIAKFAQHAGVMRVRWEP